MNKDLEGRDLPLVSLITPVYNRENLLEETILSILAQDYLNLEYIVIDDGSTDNTLAVIMKYDRKLVWRHQINSGESAAVNSGFALAQGEILGVVNSDDPLLPGAVNTIVDFFQAHPDVMVVYPDWLMIDAEGKLIKEMPSPDYDYLNMLRWHRCMPGPGTFFRREVIERLKGRDCGFRYVADFEFWLRAGLEMKFARLPEYLATFRQHSDSASVCRQGWAMAKEHIRLVRLFYARPDLPACVYKLKREAFSSAFFVAGGVIGDAPFGRALFLALAFLCAPLKYFGEYRYRLHEFRGPRKVWKKICKYGKKIYKYCKRKKKQLKKLKRKFK